MCQTCGGNKANSQIGPKSSTLALPSGDQPIVYKIENLTIHNYGSIAMLTDKPAPLGGKLTGVQPSVPATDEVSLMATRRHAQIGFRNNFPVKLQKVILTHRYSDESRQSHSWFDVGPGSTTNPELGADYATGLFTGNDLWWLEIVFEDGTTMSTDQKQCNLEEVDEASRGNLYFDIADGSFQTRTRSSPCSASFSASDQRYNSVAFVKVKNNFPVALTNLELKHKYSDDKNFTAPFQSLTLKPGDETPYWAVYYNSGFGRYGRDNWNTAFELQIPGPRNAVDKFGKGRLTSSPLDVNWTFTANNWGKSFTFEVDGRGLGYLNSTISNWITPLGYNTAAFVKIENACQQDIKEVVLQHQYSDDAKYEYVYNNIPQNGLSSQMFMMEYLTGGLHSGFDYWNITIELKNGKKYRNEKENKPCYLETADAKLITYSVSEQNFHLGQSGSCDNGMKPMSGTRVSKGDQAERAKLDELEDDVTVVEWSNERMR